MQVVESRRIPWVCHAVDQARFGATRLEVEEYLHVFMLRSGGARTRGDRPVILPDE